MSHLTKIKFTEFNGKKVENLYGYQETLRAGSSKLLHLYDENGEQLDSGNGHFPQAKWDALPLSAEIHDSDDFWNAIESLQLQQ